MNYAILKAEIESDPANKGYATFLPDAPGKIVELLNAQTEQMVKPRMITERGILSSYGLGSDAGAVFMDKLDSLAASGAPGTAPLKRMLKYLYGDSGIDIGDAETQAQLDALALAGSIAAEEATTIKAMALQPASRAEVLGLGVITEADVRAAMGE